MKEKSRKLFAKKILLNQSIETKIKSYEHLQHVFSDKKFLRHYNDIRKLFIDVNISKKRDIEAMIFHVKNDSNEKIIFKRCDIESIMFLSKIFISAEIKYWFTKLEMTDVIWVVKKVKHLIETSRKQSTIIFTNHFVLISIIKQIFLNTFNTNKLNLRLVRASQYLFVLSINIKVKFEKFHVISDALSRLFSIMNSDKLRKNDDVLEDLQYDLDALLVQSINEINTLSFDTKFARIHEYLDIYFEQEECLIEMTNVYRQFLLNSYSANFQWNKIREKLQTRENTTNIFDEIDFTLQNDLIYYSSEMKTLKLCISWSLEKDIYKMTHDDNHHCEFHRAYVRIFESLYIRHMIKRLRRYIHHCRSCLEEQTKRHPLYDELNSIRTMTLSFHTVIIDFVIALSMTLIEENAILIITNKFFKRISIIARKNKWDVFEWVRAWLNALQRENWRISRAIIFDRDSKFLEAFWNIIFRHMNVALHFTIVYHSSTDDQSERTNQTIEITIRFSLMKSQISDFTKLLLFIQTFMNNASNVSIGLFSNEILYGFKVTKPLNLLNDTNAVNAKDDDSLTFLKEERIILRTSAQPETAGKIPFWLIRLALADGADTGWRGWHSLRKITFG